MFGAIKRAYRSLFNHPAYFWAVVITLMLGIGANSSIFSVVDAVLLRPLPYPASDRLMALYENNPARKVEKDGVSPATVEDWNRLSNSFIGVSGAYTENLSETTGQLPEQLVAAIVAPRFFPVMGTPALIGRGFTDDEERMNGPNLALISERFWHRRFNGDRNVLGRKVRIRSTSLQIIGVMPGSFRFPAANVDIWLPAQMPQVVMQNREGRFYGAVARLRPGLTRTEAQADLTAVQARLASDYPATEAGWRPDVEPLKEETIGGVRQSLWILFGAVSLVLLIACSNVACLMLVRASQRERDMAVRSSLGARRSQLIRELLLEAACLAIPGGLLGLVLSAWGSALFRQAAAKLPRAEEIRVDWRIVVFTMALSMFTTVLFGLIPAFQGTRQKLAGVLATGTRTQTGGRHLAQRVLVGAEIALAIVLLVGANLLMRSLSTLGSVSLGFQTEHVLSLRVSASWGETGDPPKVAQRLENTLRVLRNTPGVESASFASGMPGSGAPYEQIFEIAGRASGQTGEKLYSDATLVNRDIFRTLDVPLVSGTTCGETTPGSQVPSPVVVNSSFAERFFSHENPLGRRLVFNVSNVKMQNEIVGVASDVRDHGYASDPKPMIYACGRGGYIPDPIYLIKTQGDPSRMANVLRQVIRGVEPTRAVYAIQPLSGSLDSTLSERRFQTLLLVLFAGTAILLAAIGLYGVVTFLVQQKTREIGLRVAIGAQTWHILLEVFRQGAIMTLGGLAIGLLCAAVLTRLISSLLFHVSPLDPVTFSVVPVALALVAFTALFFPARRAARIDPMEALRQE
jgi:putative ABC transport system permease protein